MRQRGAALTDVIVLVVCADTCACMRVVWRLICQICPLERPLLSELCCAQLAADDGVMPQALSKLFAWSLPIDADGN